MISARDVWHRIGTAVFAQSGYARETPNEDIDFESLTEATSELCWAFGRKYSAAWVLLASGGITPAGVEVFSGDDTSRSKGTHFDWMVGTVGSGTSNDIRTLGVTKEQFYGPPLNCIVLFEVKAFENYIRMVPNAAPLPKWSSNGVAEQIVASWRGQRQTKKVLRDRFAPGLSDDVFESVWREAVVKEPKLKAPGRPPNQIQVKKPN